MRWQGDEKLQSAEGTKRAVNRAALTFVSTVGKGTKCLRASCVFVLEQSLQLDARPSLDDRT